MCGATLYPRRDTLNDRYTTARVAMPPKKRASTTAAPSFATKTRGARLARGVGRRIRGHVPKSLEYLQRLDEEKRADAKENAVNARANARATTSKDARESELASRDESLALAIEHAKSKMEEFEREGARRGNGSDEEDDKDGDGKRKRRKRQENKGIGYIASKGHGYQHSAKVNMLGMLDLADEEVVRTLLGHLPVGHVNERSAIKTQHEKQHRRWFQLLSAGFNVLLYGFGSKKALMEDFERRYFLDGGVIVVNGFFPSLTPKQVVAAAAAALSDESTEVGANAPTEVLLAQIQSATRGSPTCEPRRLYIVLHNIDGPQLRTSEAQALLGELASMDRVHLIASIDHINAPLLWSKREAARFNWVWQEAATFAPYALETANLPQLLASKGEERHVRGAANVLRSLTPNGRAIFRLLAEHQLENEDSQGRPLDVFYAACREQFLVSSEVTLRAHLTEFTDHELVRSKRGHDGRDLLSIPLHADALKELLAALDA